jgi:hypothetical protein
MLHMPFSGNMASAKGYLKFHPSYSSMLTEGKALLDDTFIGYVIDFNLFIRMNQNFALY